MITITEDILKSVENFKEKLQQYHEGKLENLKAFSSIMGIYKEGPKDTYMVRPRIAGGVTTANQLQG
ncbi:MAG: Ferredoxin--nitrite reductase, partial [Firmicutes bacterium]|nr:Ferredoxin--nitrite reductase [Bacillota bacterium]